MTSDPLNSPEPFSTPDPLNPQGRSDTKPVVWSTGSDLTLDKVEVEDEVLEAVEEGKADAELYQTQEPQEAQESEEAEKVRLRDEKNRRLRGNPTFIANLRGTDTPLTRTCGYCLTRKALGNFLRGRESNFCIDCEG